jgi:hypothetical protein
MLELDNPARGAQVMEQMASRLRQHQVIELYLAVTGPSHGESTGNIPVRHHQTSRGIGATRSLTFVANNFPTPSSKVPGKF